MYTFPFAVTLIYASVNKTHCSISFDFMMCVLVAVTFHGPNAKSCLLLLNPCDVMFRIWANIHEGTVSVKEQRKVLQMIHTVIKIIYQYKYIYS